MVNAFYNFLDLKIVIGYSAFAWEPDEPWDAGTATFYDQDFRYNVLELVAKSLDENTPDFPRNSRAESSVAWFKTQTFR